MILRLLRTEPAVLRGLLVAITALAAAVLGRKVDTEWVDTTIGIYMLVAPLAAGLLIRQAVTPVRSQRPPGSALTVNVAPGLSPEQAAEAVDRVVRRRHQADLYPREGA
ncbi:hypothetical protein ACFWPK_22450 [Nocardia sp. NPDC058519]|uniref:hypothetical protein n=1 Tax=Nocardia sp. NPDC058519 TaxID=3346535 RepID=UPI0036520CA8